MTDGAHYLRPVEMVKRDLGRLCIIHDVNVEPGDLVKDVVRKLFAKAEVDLNKVWYRLTEEAAHYADEPWG